MICLIDELERLHVAAEEAQKDPDYEPGLESGATVTIERAAYAFYRYGPALLATLREMREALERIDDDAQFDTGLELRAIARAALERARERLGAK